jgi:protein-disulfide isomerase
LTRKRKTGKYGDSPAPVRRKSCLLVLVGVIGGIAGIIGLAIFVSGGVTNRLTANEYSASLVQQMLAPTTPGAYALGGDLDAKITIVEFGDYQCNSCDRFHEFTKDRLMSDIVNVGKAKFMYKDFNINDRVLKPANGSTLASEAAYYAGEQGKFWQYHDELFHKQQREGIEWISYESLRQFAANVGVSDTAAFSSCLDSHKYAGMVRENYNLAQKLGLGATPTFLIIAEGKQPVKLVGAHPYSSFEAVINDLQ